LQASSTVEVPIPGATGEVGLAGENFELSTGSDLVELREPVGEVVDTISEYELPGLKSGHLTTSEGDTEFHQYLRLKDGTNLQNMTVNYVQDDDDIVGPFLVVDTDAPFMEWEIQFPEGFESELDGTSGTLSLDDIEDKTFNILGTDFTVVKAEVDYDDGSDFEMTLMGGSIADTLREGETRVYSIDGVDYEVTLVFVSDPSSGSSNVEAKFSVNGELTQALEEGDTDTLSGGLQIGVRDILVNAREGVASFFLGADKIVFTDANVNESTSYNGDVEINNENINDGGVQVLGAYPSTGKFEITSIKYQLTMDADQGTTAYIPPGHGVREFMDRPESLISDSLDFYFGGLRQVDTTPFDLDPNGDDEYELTFTNLQGQTYTFPLLSNENGVWKFGDGDDDLIFVEGTGAEDHTIGREDYFIVSNDRGTDDADKSVTNVLRYEDYDNTDFTVELENLATGAPVNVPIATDGTGSLVIGGHTYAVNVSDRTAAEPDLAIDLNADGAYSEKVTLTTWGGVIVDIAQGVTLNSSVDSSAPYKNVTALQTVVGNGLSISGVPLFDNSSDAEAVYMNATVLAKNFDTSSNGVESIVWYVDQATSNEIDLDFSESDYTGPLTDASGAVADVDEFQFNELEDDDDYQVGMTDWGILITEYDPSGNNDPNELTLEIPKQQVTAQVFVTLGSVEQVEGASGSTATHVNPIAVGLAVLDRDAPAVGSENLIVVGGPCANSVAAELLGNPENCAEGFEAGKAMIRAWDKGDTVAILVAGYEATETLGASRVLAQYEDYSLSGSEVEVVVADLNSITVQAPTVHEDMADDMADEE
jgi:hypothetical protein